MRKVITKFKKLFFALRYRWVGTEAFFVILKVLNDAFRLPLYKDEQFKININQCFNKKWLKQENGQQFYDFNGVKMPYITEIESVSALKQVFEDVFLIPCRFGDNHDKKNVERVDFYVPEGAYGYIDGSFDVSVKADDIVIDAGAWFGDFSAYAASKGAVVYAFEPEKRNFEILCETKRLNPNSKIIPTQKGLSDYNKTAEIFINGNLSHSTQKSCLDNEKQEIILTTLDRFVEENHLTKVDFIKSDIEGDERNMLRGAKETLRKFASKLALCTYHLPDDAEVMTKIILEANPNYTIKYMRHKLFAVVI
ncbi:MAG: FkbM family methyltransferase [Dysgonamonadaceae bacterium]|jgi:FkbM family methyltransferase|nr:FkbM family methyltransferase [Dysgonamonadaceae bacterium]